MRAPNYFFRLFSFFVGHALSEASGESATPTLMNDYLKSHPFPTRRSPPIERPSFSSCPAESERTAATENSCCRYRDGASMSDTNARVSAPTLVAHRRTFGFVGCR